MSDRATRMNAAITASPRAVPIRSVGRPEPVLRRPSPTQMAFITPVCSLETSRVWYTKRQMIDAPTSDSRHRHEDDRLGDLLAAALVGEDGDGEPERRREERDVTTHHRLLMIVPRIAVKAAKHTSRRRPPAARPSGLPSSTARPVCRFDLAPTITAIASRTTPMKNGTLVNMFVQFGRSQLASSGERRRSSRARRTPPSRRRKRQDRGPDRRDDEHHGDEQQRRAEEDPRP